MGEFNLEKNLDVLADVITKRMSEAFEGKEKLEAEIKELEQTNHEIIEKNKALLEENKNLRWQYEQFQVEEDKLMGEIETLRKENEKLKWAESKRASWEQAFHKMFLKVLTLQNKLETLEEEKEHLQQVCNDLRETMIEDYQKNILKEENKADKDILFYQEQNRKLMESNKSLVEEVERLRKENKYLERENAKLREIKGRHTLDC